MLSINSSHLQGFLMPSNAWYDIDLPGMYSPAPVRFQIHREQIEVFVKCVLEHMHMSLFPMNGSVFLYYCIIHN